MLNQFGADKKKTVRSREDKNNAKKTTGRPVSRNQQAVSRVYRIFMGSDPFYDAEEVQGPRGMLAALDVLVPLKSENKIIRKVREMRKSSVVAVYRILLANDLLSFHAAEIFSQLYGEDEEDEEEEAEERMEEEEDMETEDDITDLIGHLMDTSDW